MFLTNEEEARVSDGDAETRLSEALVSSHSPTILPRISKNVRDKKRERRGWRHADHLLQ